MVRILIIDDELSVRSYLKRLLVRWGYEVDCAPDGETGLQRCHEWQPHAVLTDIYMPGQDGLEFIRALRKQATGAGIIAMSGGGQIGQLDVLRSAKLMGARQVLTKPFDSETLKAVLQEMAPAPAAAAEEEAAPDD